jgi:2-C-methyl-D-erythritol 2,4-cyclodiphosphate synthase
MAGSEDEPKLRQETALKLRIGSGFDFHRLEPGRPLMVGGVRIPGAAGPAGHSNGDSLIHAVIDALFGALSLGDIGTYFPPTDPEYKNISSMKLLRSAMEIVTASGASVVNLDATVFLEAPKISPYTREIKESLSNAIGAPSEAVSVKAKTMEGVGPIGEGKGYSAMAVVLMEVE